MTHFKAVADNKYADSGTAAKAKQQMAVAESSQKSMKGDMKATYNDAVADYKAKRYDAAREKFETLQASGYKPGAFQKKPADYLKDIPAAGAGATAVVAQSTTREEAAPAAPAPSGGSRAARGRSPRCQSAHPAATPAQPQASTPAPQGPTEASRLVQEAATAQSNQNYNLAYQLYSQAAAVDPNNQQAQAGKRDMQSMLSGAGQGGPANVGVADAGGGILDRVQGTVTAQKQEITYNFNSNIEQANKSIEGNNFAEARSALDRARASRDANPNVFTEEEVRRFDSQLASTGTRLDSAQRSIQRTSACASSRKKSLARHRKIAIARPTSADVPSLS